MSMTVLLGAFVLMVAVYLARYPDGRGPGGDEGSIFSRTRRLKRTIHKIDRIKT